MQNNARFRRALLAEAVETLQEGDLDTGKALLCDYVNATFRFETLAKEIGKDSKSVYRMLGSRGNPTAENIFSIVKILQDVADISLQVKANRHKAA